MKLNWVGYYNDNDGFGRFNSHLVYALKIRGVEVKTATEAHLTMPRWMLEQEGVDWNNLTISSLPPYLVRPVPGRHWVLTMIEGSVAPDDWVDALNSSGAERILVPCQHNKITYESSGVTIPIFVLPGGTDEFEFYPAYRHEEPPVRPYTFLTFADRKFRKGWEEVYYAFYKAFGGKTEGVKDVRLMVKSLPRKFPTILTLLQKTEDLDSRIILRIEDAPDIRSVYTGANCLVLPSHSEGWGMPHREAAMMGLPVITQKYSGLDDGYTEEWALVVEGGKMQPIPKENKLCLGEWMVADVDRLAEKMWWCYENYQDARSFGYKAREWLKKHQTWYHSASILMEML